MKDLKQVLVNGESPLKRGRAGRRTNNRKLLHGKGGSQTTNKRRGKGKELVR